MRQQSYCRWTEKTHDTPHSVAGKLIYLTEYLPLPPSVPDWYFDVSCCCISAYVLMNLEFSHQMFEKYSYITFYEYSSGGSGIATCGQTDRGIDRQTDRHRDLHSSRFSHFRERSLLTEINLNYSTTLGSYRAVNTLCLNYKTQLLCCIEEYLLFSCLRSTQNT